MIDDAELLQRYAEDRSDDAFAELVRRHIDLVYSVALRATGGDAHRAQDATQRVFCDLARKAAALARRPSLTGWLHRSARYAAIDLVRSEVRRQQRELKAEAMNRPHPDRESPNWEELRPLLDEVLARVADVDRDLILLRFFENRPFAEIGQRLSLSEDAARMRVERALAKIRTQLARRGIESTVAALGGAFSAHAATSAPATVVSVVTAQALGTAGTSSGAVVAFLLAMSKFKTAAIASLLVVAAGTTLVEVRANRVRTAEYETLRREAGEVARPQPRNAQPLVEAADAVANDPDARELARLKARRAELLARPVGVVDAEIRPFANEGRGTPEAAFRTFYWAVQHDPALAASFFRFTDDTPENRAAFMANFSPTIRARFPTPEALCAAIVIMGLPSDPTDTIVASQVVSAVDDHGPDQVRLTIWSRGASGHEARGGGRYVLGPDGWGPQPVSLADKGVIKLITERLDPATGNLVLPKPAPVQAH